MRLHLGLPQDFDNVIFRHGQHINPQPKKEMKKITLKPFLVALIASFALVFTACENNDAGDAIEDAGDEVEDAVD